MPDNTTGTLKWRAVSGGSVLPAILLAYTDVELR